MRRSTRSFLLLAITAAAAACADGSSPTSPNATAPRLAKSGTSGGGGTGGTVTPPPTTRCVSITVTNNGQTVRRASAMPELKYKLANCGSASANVTVTITEVEGFLSAVCPSPVDAPATFTIAARDAVSATARVLRSPCGFLSYRDDRILPYATAWQGHNLMLIVTDNVDGTVLGTDYFSWQDDINGAV